MKYELHVVCLGLGSCKRRGSTGREETSRREKADGGNE